MTLDPDPTRHAVDLEQLFSGDRTWVKLCAELLERSIRDHQPVLDRADPTCSGCAHLRRAYEDLLAQSVALIERSARAESERTRLSGEFLRSVRHSHPERARQYETNPRVGRPLTSLSPELLADLVIAWSELTRAEASDTTAAKLAQTKASASAVIDELADKIRALAAERDQLRGLRASMGLDELGLPSMIVDKLASGTITLHEFLRQAAGAGGSRAFSVGGKEVVVSLGAPADPSRRVLPARAAIEPAVPATPDPAPRPMVPLPITAPALTTSPEPTRSTPSIEHAATTASAADGRAPALCLYVALLVHALIERELRKTMADAGVTELPLYPEERACKTPTAARVLELFAPLSRTVVLHNDEILVVVAPELDPLQARLLELLGIPQSAYGTT